ncbi:formylglycine-generating enzyme family protein [Pseudomonas syringae]|nr:formylglycine-generating enzyme family protein [Pseudomonas syringae]
MKTRKLIFGFAIAFGTQGCERPASPTAQKLATLSDAELRQFVASVEDNLVFVEGGEFLMGDFGPQYASERAPYDRDNDSKPLHKVEVGNYSISKFKVTNAEFQFYLRYNDMKLRGKGTVFKSDWQSINSLPNTPAHLDWYEAEKYCNWLTLVTKLPFALPTEAQWEFAARSRGQFLMVSTDDGTYKSEPQSLRTSSYSPKGINISSNGDRSEFAKKMGWNTGFLSPLPVDMFPPNPLGLYSMSDNGYEWVSDWYDPEYYKYSPLKNPQGPDNPVFKNIHGYFTKVMRGQGYANPYFGGGVNVHRTDIDPLGRFDEEGTIVLNNKTARCVVNSPEPVVSSSSIIKLGYESSKLKVPQ